MSELNLIICFPFQKRIFLADPIIRGVATNLLADLKIRGVSANVFGGYNNSLRRNEDVLNNLSEKKECLENEKLHSGPENQKGDSKLFRRHEHVQDHCAGLRAGSQPGPPFFDPKEKTFSANFLQSWKVQKKRSVQSLLDPVFAIGQHFMVSSWSIYIHTQSDRY
jgi:hypothetical protein